MESAKQMPVCYASYHDTDIADDGLYRREFAALKEAEKVIDHIPGGVK